MESEEWSDEGGGEDEGDDGEEDKECAWHGEMREVVV